MEHTLFVEGDPKIFTNVKSEVNKAIVPQNQKNFKPILWFLMFVVVLCISIFTYNHFHSQNNVRFDFLVQKLLNKEELSASEWNELCQLLPSIKGIVVNDCENCQDYTRALVGGKHAVHLKKYQECSDKEIQKGINSYQKQIDLHQEKIRNPEKSLPNWDTLDVRQQKDLVEKKWNNDIKRLQEQKKILECILKNRTP
jgi:hypothetical protein